jgi:hypothetical protein
MAFKRSRVRSPPAPLYKERVYGIRLVDPFSFKSPISHHSVRFIEDAHVAQKTLADGISAIGSILTNADGIAWSSSDTLGNLGRLIEDIGGLINAFEGITYDLAFNGLRPNK